jgi:hypothetical protein
MASFMVLIYDIDALWDQPQTGYGLKACEADGSRTMIDFRLTRG